MKMDKDDEIHEVALNDINASFSCPLCYGYLIDCTVAEQCGHAYCRSCVLAYIQSGQLACLQCSRAFNESDPYKPYEKLRADYALQRLIYKLVPGLINDETERRSAFLKSEKKARRQIKRSCDEKSVFFNDRSVICIELIHLKAESAKKSGLKEASSLQFLRLEMSTRLSILEQFIKLRNNFIGQMEIVFSATHTFAPLLADFSITELAYMTKWDQSRPLQIYYKSLDALAPPVPASMENTKIMDGKKNSNPVVECQPSTSGLSTIQKPERQPSVEISPPPEPVRRQTEPKAGAKLKLKFNRNVKSGHWRVENTQQRNNNAAGISSKQPMKVTGLRNKRCLSVPDETCSAMADSFYDIMDDPNGQSSDCRKRVFVDLRDMVKSSKIAKVLPLPTLPAVPADKQRDEGNLIKDSQSAFLYNTGLVPASPSDTGRDIFSIQQILNSES
ncbi:polycomb complex protein BMI-1-A-like isoform X2 [Paramacrobiotus metropolitanus]|nr:polycomb complex protein BMI-1-A-like isoform X2 [Paramacrobiotus metropolitanus]XP_055350482.1 polycomb complex protein BMI-1-A-like isoform X2 [Paramacrobiotus metropolitanus]